nr:alpha/beta hydrolase [Tropicimonas sediminicola]
MTANYQVGCRQLGLAADSYAPPPPGVESRFPTLVVNGALDTGTPAEWGMRAAETLSDATVVTIPMAGHTAGLLNKCGNALVQAFILSPEEDLNRSCADAARPVYATPEDPLPQ